MHKDNNITLALSNESYITSKFQTYTELNSNLKPTDLIFPENLDTLAMLVFINPFIQFKVGTPNQNLFSRTEGTNTMSV